MGGPGPIRPRDHLVITIRFPQEAKFAGAGCPFS